MCVKQKSRFLPTRIACSVLQRERLQTLPFTRTKSHWRSPSFVHAPNEHRCRDDRRPRQHAMTGTPWTRKTLDGTLRLRRRSQRILIFRGAGVADVVVAEVFEVRRLGEAPHADVPAGAFRGLTFTLRHCAAPAAARRRCKARESCASASPSSGSRRRRRGCRCTDALRYTRTSRIRRTV